MSQFFKGRKLRSLYCFLTLPPPASDNLGLKSYHWRWSHPTHVTLMHFRPKKTFESFYYTVSLYLWLNCFNFSLAGRNSSSGSWNPLLYGNCCFYYGLKSQNYLLTAVAHPQKKRKCMNKGFLTCKQQRIFQLNDSRVSFVWVKWQIVFPEIRMFQLSCTSARWKQNP